MRIRQVTSGVARNISYDGFRHKDAVLANLLLGIGLVLLGVAIWLGHWTGIVVSSGLFLLGLEAHVLQVMGKRPAPAAPVLGKSLEGLLADPAFQQILERSLVQAQAGAVVPFSVLLRLNEQLKTGSQA